MSERLMNPLGPAAVIVLAALVGLWFGRPASAPTTGAPDEGAEPVVTVAEERVITVHVAGSVVRPGLVELRSGSRVADAVAAAGGATPRASLVALNLAQEVMDGQQIVVPSVDGPATDAVDPDGPIRLNSADVGQLETLPGVGPVLAAAIVSHRNEHGPFSTVEDLLSVPGIGEAKLATIRDHLSAP